MSLLSVLAKGGWLMIPIGLFSLVAVGIFIERIMVLRKARINLNASVMARIQRTDLAQMDRWFERGVTPQTLAAVFSGQS